RHGKHRAGLAGPPCRVTGCDRAAIVRVLALIRCPNEKRSSGMSNVRDFFSSDYADARKRFSDVAKAAGFTPERHVNAKVKGPRSEELSTEIVRIGPTNAENVILVTSGTHGVEGFCGSGAQVGWLVNGVHKELPKNTALVLIHAINPHGFAHER